MAATHPSTYQLGTPTVAHRAGLSVWLTLFAGAIFTLVGGYGVIVLLAGASRAARPSMLLAALFFGGVGVAFLVVGCLQSRQSIQVFEHGFTYIKTGAVRAVRWDAIDSIRCQAVHMRVNFIPVGTLHTYTIRTSQGETIKLTNSVGKVAKLGALIQAEAFRHLMPRAIESYNAGSTLQFGKLSVNQAGIGNGKEIVPWAQIKSVQVSNGFIAIKKDGKWLNWANVAVAQTPNFFVFLALVGRVVGVKS
ncbi:MAG TPA: DUF6585 family protein [Roseiflexaceae bacterium]|nr:DUF6585 family protein [Roseiflexaceae bacterium]